MRAPTPFEEEHYRKIVGRKIVAVVWEDYEGEPMPVLLLKGKDRHGHPASLRILADPEGNGPGHMSTNSNRLRWPGCGHRLNLKTRRKASAGFFNYRVIFEQDLPG